MKNCSRLFTALFLSLTLITGLSAQSVIKMNEVYAAGVVGNKDWIEIYNSSSAAVNIGGYKIYDNGAPTKGKKLFPAGTMVPAKGFVVIIVDTATFVGDTTGFGLSGTSGETVWLENAAGALIDTVAFPPLGADTSYARIPDGSTVWKKVTPVTRGGSNVLIKMNEIYAAGVVGNKDWIEIYNSSSAAVNIGGYKIYDNGAPTKGKKLLPTGTMVPAKGFTVIIVDTATFVGDTTGFGLSGTSGETVWLEDASGMVIDTVAFPALGTDTSYARVPDGSNVFVKKSPVTKGATNGTGSFVQPNSRVASEFALDQNYPNPFNPATTIRFSMPNSQRVTMKVFDLLGKEVATVVDEYLEAGSYSIRFNAASLSSGIYMYTLQSGQSIVTRKMMVLK